MPTGLHVSLILQVQAWSIVKSGGPHLVKVFLSLSVGFISQLLSRQSFVDDLECGDFRLVGFDLPFHRAGEVAVKCIVALAAIAFDRLLGGLCHVLGVDGEYPPVDVFKWEAIHFVLLAVRTS